MALSLVAMVVCALAGPAGCGIPSWTTYHRDALRSGVDPDSSSHVAPTQLWQTTPALDGEIYAQPLVYGSRVYVATESNTVYALDAATGAIIWQKSAGQAVPGNQLPCGNIATVGITSTPVIDPVTERIYVVADTWDGSDGNTIRHRLVGFNLADGSLSPGMPLVVDPPLVAPASQLQRSALALDAGKVIIPYGGNNGDCGSYHGWLMAAPETGGSLLSYEVDATGSDHGGAIWGSGNGPAVDGSGDIWAATGNGYSGSTYDGQESVLKLDANLNLLDHWTPANWQTLDNNDQDIGSSEPLLLPGGLVFQIGKTGVGYLLAASSLGGTGANPLFQASVCSGSYGGGVYSSGVIYVACSDGLHALALNATTRSFTPLMGWNVNPQAIGAPIIAGGLVWSVGWTKGELYGLDPSSGSTTFSQNLGSFDHFASPSAAGGRLFVANGNKVTAFTIATPPPSLTTTALGSSANPSAPGGGVTYTATVSPGPDAGTVAFTDGGTPIPGCAAVAVSTRTGQAQCSTSYSRPGSHAIVARYSGDAYYADSQSATLIQVAKPTSLPQGGNPPPRVVYSPPVISRLRRSASGKTLTLTLTLSATAKLTVVITRTGYGRRVKGRCRVSRTEGRRCSLTVRVETLSLTGARGRNSFKLPLGRLPAGRYTATLIARNATGQLSKRYTLEFTVKKAPKIKKRRSV